MEEFEKALAELFEGVASTEQVMLLGAEIAGIKMALCIMARLHPEPQRLRAELVAAIEKLKPEYRASRSGTVLMQIVSFIDTTQKAEHAGTKH